MASGQTPECLNDEQIIPPEATATDYVGVGIDLDRNWAVVGAPTTDSPGVNNHGAAYLFERSQEGWVQRQRVVATELIDFEFFGEGVEIDGDVAVMAAPGHDVFTAEDAGAVYVFRRDVNQPPDSQWSEEFVITADQPIANSWLGGAVNGSHHGVAVDGRIIVAGAPHKVPSEIVDPSPGRAYIFIDDQGAPTWSQEAILTPPNNEGQNVDRFGWSVDISGRRAIIGAPYHDEGFATNGGRAYIYVRDTAQSPPVWVHEATLTQQFPSSNDNFGYSVALDGDEALVGAWDPSDEGFAILYRNSTNGWEQVAELYASNGHDGSLFGASVSLSGDMALVGAFGQLHTEYPSSATGAAYLYQRNPFTPTEQWDEALILLPGLQVANAGDEFGISIAIDGDDAFIGAGGDEPNCPPPDACGDQRGAIYIFPTLPACQ